MSLDEDLRRAESAGQAWRGPGAINPDGGVTSEARPHQPPHTRPWHGSERGSRLETFLRSPTARIPLPGRPAFEVATDRVRARPAISPQLSMMIGVTAIGLGAWGTLFPNSVKRALGVRAPAPVVSLLFGLRESITGWTLAGDPTKAWMLWVRVGGDVFDLATLTALDSRSNPSRGAARVARALVLGIAALDLAAAVRMSTVKRTCEAGE